MKKTYILMSAMVMSFIILIATYLSSNYFNMEKAKIQDINTNDIVASTSEDSIKHSTNLITLKIKNTSDIEYTYGKHFSLETYKDGSWYTVPFKKDTAFNEIAISLSPHKTNTESINLSLFNKLSNGKYRIVKSLYSQGEELTVDAEFDVR